MARSIRSPQSTTRDVSTYWDRTQRPLQCLYFLLPLIVLYEVGILLWVEAVDIRARGLLRMLFEYLGVTGVFLPGVVVMVVLLSWHLMKRDPWRPEPRLYLGMAVESLLLTLPLLAFAALIVSESAAGLLASLAGLNAEELGDWRARLTLALGAGIYEELVFRLVGLTLLHLVLVDWLALPKDYGYLGAVAITSVAFSLYHFSEDSPFQWGAFAFYTLAGGYFAVIYLWRGFGIVVTVHALYNVVLVLLSLWHERG